MEKNLHMRNELEREGFLYKLFPAEIDYFSYTIITIYGGIRYKSLDIC